MQKSLPGKHTVSLLCTGVMMLGCVLGCNVTPQKPASAQQQAEDIRQTIIPDAALLEQAGSLSYRTFVERWMAQAHAEFKPDPIMKHEPEPEGRPISAFISVPSSVHRTEIEKIERESARVFEIFCERHGGRAIFSPTPRAQGLTSCTCVAHAPSGEEQTFARMLIYDAGSQLWFMHYDDVVLNFLRRPDIQARREARKMEAESTRQQQEQAQQQREQAQRQQREEEARRQQVMERQMQLAQEAQQRQIQAETTRFRTRLKTEDETNCGPVIEMKGTLVKIYFPVANYGNEHWVPKNRLFPPSYGCRFLNGQYQPPYDF